jgi:hypothetical protein
MRAPRSCNVPIVTHRQVTTGDGVRLLLGSLRPERLSKLVLVDEWAFSTSSPDWSPAEREAAGAIVTLNSGWQR